MDVSVIYVNYNCSRLTIQSIKSVISYTKDISYEIIVVDNSSSKEETESLKNFCDEKGIKLITSDNNLGFGRANNLGNKYAKGKYIFLLNPDTILLNNAIYELYNFAESNGISICGGNLSTKDNTPTHSYWMTYPSIKSEIYSMLSDIPLKLAYHRSYEYNHTNKSIEVGYITGADLFVKKETFDQAKGFDEDFFMYFEETELQYRLRKSGYKIYNTPRANIIHLESQTIESREKKIELFYKSKELFFTKAYTSAYCKTAKAIEKISCCIRITYFYITRNTSKVHYWKTISNQL